MNENKQLNDSASKDNVQTAGDRLRSFCEAVNERWPEAEVRWGLADTDDYYIALFWGSCVVDYYSLQDRESRVVRGDIHNSKWVIWTLDRLEELAMAPSLYVDIRGNQKYTISLASAPAADGSTRAEAAFNALCAALGVSDSVGGG